ncbi:unnamed protein product [Absidia cylindrospora]
MQWDLQQKQKQQQPRKKQKQQHQQTTRKEQYQEKKQKWQQSRKDLNAKILDTRKTKKAPFPQQDQLQLQQSLYNQLQELNKQRGHLIEQQQRQQNLHIMLQQHQQHQIQEPESTAPVEHIQQQLEHSRKETEEIASRLKKQQIKPQTREADQVRDIPRFQSEVHQITTSLDNLINLLNNVESELTQLLQLRPPATAQAPSPPPTTAQAPSPPPTTAQAPSPPPTTAQAPSPPPTTAQAPTPPPAQALPETPVPAHAPITQQPIDRKGKKKMEHYDV